MELLIKSIDRIFWDAAQIASDADRSAYLARACGDDVKLHQRVLHLLKVRSEADDLLEAHACMATLDEPLVEKPGTLIGPYKLLEQIGEGGMGLVFVAEQQQPVRRKVALKVIKPGMDSKQIIARFEAERQALAIMDHPNIAKVLDAGSTTRRASVLACSDDAGKPPATATSEDACATETGRPYFVMELIKGKPITDYCDRNQLGTRQRLELFLDVCQAVQHAHQKGIIHRDLKPSNVLVEVHDVRPVVKIIDFGIAKAIGRQLTDKTLHTGIAQMIGTPLYMSPEQAGLSSLDVDTRSDVYALGVLLYELLTGSTPFDGEALKQAGYDELRRIVREEEPPKPSARLSTLHHQLLSTIAEQRGMEPRKLSQQVRDELDWIVMKTLEKDRNRRYETASALAADVQRYLQDEPVEACPPSRRYRLGKFLRKHRTGVLTTAALLAAALVLGAGIGYVALDRAGRQLETEQAVAGDLTEADFLQRQDQWAKAAQALERAHGRLQGSGLTALQARVEQQRREVSFVDQIEKARMQMLQVADRADRDFAGADRLYEAAFAENGMDLTALGREEANRLIAASAIHVHLVRALDNWAYCKDHLPKGDGKPLRDIAQAADKDPWRRKLRDPTLRKNRAGLEILAAEEAVLDQPPELLLILFALLEDAKAEAAAISLLKRAQPFHPDDFWINYQLANSLCDIAATAAEATAFGRAALAIRPESSVVYLTLANALGSQGLPKEPEAEALVRKAMAFQPDNPHVYNHLGNTLYLQRRLPEAAAHRKAIELKPDFAVAYSNLGSVLTDQHKLPEAEAACRKAMELKPDFPVAYSNLGATLAMLEKLPQAEAAYRKAIEVAPKNPLRNAMGYLNFGGFLIKQRRFPEAEAACRKAIELKPDFALAHSDLGAAFSRQHKLPEAEAEYRKAIELDPKNAIAYRNLGLVLGKQHKPPEAEAASRKAIELDPKFASAYNDLGSSLDDQRRFPEAEAAYRKAIELDPTNAFAYSHLGNALGDQHKLPEAEAAFRKAITLDPTDPLAYDILGCCLYIQGKLAEAEAAFRKSIQLDPKGDAKTYSNLGNTLLKQKKFPDAEAAFRKSIQLDPKGNPSTYSDLGDTLLKQKKFPEAEAAFRKLAELAPSEVAFTNSLLAFSLSNQLKHREAVAAYRKVLAIDPDYALGYYNGACAAVMAAGGQGDGATLVANERAHLRSQALTWLRFSLTAMRKELEKEPAKAYSRIEQEMQHWQKDSDFNGVRGEPALAKLPEAERREWRKLWEEVEELRKRAAAGK